jgi:hypothetical protein
MRHFFHKWGKWSAPYMSYGGCSYQQRRCLWCNMATIRKVALNPVAPPLSHETNPAIVLEPSDAS